MPSPLIAAGALGEPSLYAPIHTNRFFTGLWTNRNPLRDAATPYLYEKFYQASRFDSVIGGQNMELSPRMTPVRSPGLSVYNSQTFPRIKRFYEFRQFTGNSETISLIADTASVIYDVTGPSTKTAIFTKSTGAGSAFFKSLGNILYFGDGVEAMKYLQVKGTWVTQPWGIAIGAGTSTGPNGCGTGADVAVTGGTAWANPGNVTAADGAFATVTLAATSSSFSLTQASGGQVVNAAQWQAYGGGWITAFLVSGLLDYLVAENFNFNIPSTASIQGLTATVTAYTEFLDGSTIKNVAVYYAGAATGTVKNPNTNFTTTPTVRNYGGDNWNASLTPLMLNNPTFGIGFQVNAPSYQPKHLLSFKATAYYSLPGSATVSDYLSASNYSFALAADPVSGYLVEIKGVQGGNITASALHAGGSGYAVNDTGTITNGAIQAAYKVDTVSAGAVATYHLTSLGLGCTVASNVATSATSGGGSGFTVDITTVSSNPSNSGLIVQLVLNGVPVGMPKTGIQLPAANGYVSLGGANDSWTALLRSADVNNSTFGVIVQGSNSDGSSTAAWGVDFARITLTSGGAAPAVALVAGALTTANGGYKYAVAYGNSNSGECSTASAVTASTGNFSSKNVQLTLVASTDSQVDQIRVFRTADGGSTLLELPTSPYPNSSGNITDSNPDITLGLVQAPINHNNDQPPASIINLTYHLSRMWGSYGNTVVYTRTTDATAGANTSCFPPNNYCTFPALVTRLWPCSLGLIVFTLSDVWLIQNTSANVILPPVMFMEHVGLSSYDAFTVRGSTVYMMLSNGRTVSFDPGAGEVEIGEPIADDPLYAVSLKQFNPSQAYCTWYVPDGVDQGFFVADGSTGWFRMAQLPAPETGIAWSPRRYVTGGCSAVKACEIAPGVERLLVGPGTSGPILQRDPSVTTDNGTPFAASIIFGSVVLAQSSQLAECAWITPESLNLGGSRPTVGVLLGEVKGSTFETLYKTRNDPPLLPASISLYADRYDFLQNQQPVFCRHLQVEFSWPAEAFAAELLSYTIVGAIHHELRAQ